MMPRYTFFLAMIFSALLTACGGGGGGGGSNGGNGGGSVSGGSGGSTSITVSPASLTFNAVEGSNVTDSKTVSVTFKGDAMLIGYPTGTPAADWLIVDTDTYSQSPVTARFTASAAGLPKGTYTTTIRFLTGKEDGSQIKYADVPVTFNVSGGLKVDITPLSFSSIEGGQLPVSQLIRLHSDSIPANWQLAMEYDGNVSGWIDPVAPSGTMNSVDSSVGITTKALPRGHYTARVFVQDSKGQIRGIVPITYDVTAGFTVTGETQKTITEQATVTDLKWPLVLQTNYSANIGANLKWQITSNQPWLSVVNSSGDFSSTQNIQLQLSAEKLWLLDDGDLNATLTLAVANSAVQPVDIPIRISLNLKPILFVNGLDNASVSLSYYIDNNTTETNLTKTLQVQTNVGSAFNNLVHWQAVSGNSWLTVLNKNGDTGNNSSLKLQINKDELASLGNGSYETLVNLIADNPRYKVSLTPVSLAMRLSTVENIAPYVAYTGRSESVVIRGKDFAIQNGLQVDVGGVLVDATVVNDSEIHINYPSLSAEQRLKVVVPNALNISRGGADLVFKKPPVYTTQKITVDTDFYKMTLDPERQAVLLSGRYANEIGRLRLTSSGWQSDSFPAQNAQTAAVTVDGKDILVSIGIPGSSSSSGSIVHLNPSTLAIKKTAPIIPVYPAYGAYDIIAPLNDGRTLLITSDQWPYAMFYPSQERFNPPSSWGTQMILSRDRSRMLTGGVNSGADNYSYDSNDSVFTPRQLNIVFFRTNYISMSSNANRLVASNSVYDHDFNFLGSLAPVTDSYNLAVTPDGKNVYVAAVDQNGHPYIKRHNISGATGPFPADAVNPAFAIDADNIVENVMVSDDGGALFVLTVKYVGQNPDSSYLYVFPIVN